MGIPPPGNAMVKELRGLIKARVESFAILAPTTEIFSLVGVESERPQGRSTKESKRFRIKPGKLAIYN